MNDKEKKLEQLEALARQHDEEKRKADISHAGRVQLGLLRARLLRLGVVSSEEFAEAKGKFHLDEETGWIRAWWEIDGVVFTTESSEGSVDRKIRIVHEANGTREWSELDEEGQPTSWTREPPPWTTSN